MTLKATIPLDAIRVHLNAGEFAEAFSYTDVDLTGIGIGDVTTTITGLFDPALDVDDGSVINTGIEVLIANGTVFRIAMATDASSGVFVQGETLTGGTSNATHTFVGQAAGILYFGVISGTFVLSETLTGGTSGATWVTHATPAIAREGIILPKAGDRFTARGFEWQVDSVDDEVVAGSHLIGAQRAAPVPA